MQVPQVLGRAKVQTDHKPILWLLGADLPIPMMSLPRVQRWAMTLSGYTYNIVYRRGVDHGNADCMSRLLAPGFLEGSPVPADVVLTLETPHPSPLLWCGSGPARTRYWPNLCDFLRKAGQTP